MKRDLVERAYDAYRHGRYQVALDLYREASEVFGDGMFDFNIRACEQRLEKSRDRRNPPHTGTREVDSVHQQLKETQALLEYYYQRCRELEYFAQKDD